MKERGERRGKLVCNKVLSPGRIPHTNLSLEVMYYICRHFDEEAWSIICNPASMGLISELDMRHSAMICVLTHGGACLSTLCRRVIEDDEKCWCHTALLDIFVCSSCRLP